MSLTGELKKKASPVTCWFEESLANVAPISKEWYAKVKPVPIVRPDTKLSIPPTVGTAFDYRLRYYFAVTPIEELVAATGMRLVDAQRRIGTQRAAPDAFLDQYGSPPAAASPIGELLLDFRERLAAFLAEVQPTGRELGREAEQLLCRYCYVLAWFDEPFRAGLFINSPLYTLQRGATVDDLLALPDQIWIDDLVALSHLFAQNSYAEFALGEAILNPRFSGSNEIGGADADLIADRCLIEIKTTVSPKFSRKRILYELLGYVFLDYEDEYAIDAVAVYLSRQALTIRWPLIELLGTLLECDRVSVPELRASFREAVRVARVDPSVEVRERRRGS